MPKLTLYIGSTSRLTVSEIKDFDGADVTATGVESTIFNENGEIVATATLVDQGGGVWQGSYPPQSLERDATYEVQVVTTADTGAVLTQRESSQAIYKGF